MVEIKATKSISNLKNLLNTIEEAIDRFKISSLKRPFEACQRLFAEKPIIDVVILGQFKSGKSSFLNSLIGKSILPVGVIPVTTAITKLQYGEAQQAVVTHFDGKKTQITLEELADYTSEAKNPANEKNVEVIDIALPALKSYKGLRLVDTPGLGSVFQYHKTTSENWLPEVGAALLAISADRPLSENDLQLIRELTVHTPNIILLLTKADLLTPEQRSEITAFFKDTLKKELNREFPTYFYSTRSETEYWKKCLEHDLFHKLVANRSNEFHSIVLYKERSLAQRCLSYLNIALQTSQKNDVDREALKNKILNERVNYDLIREEIFIITRESQNQTRTHIATYLEQFEAPLCEKITKELREEMPTWRGNLWQLTRRYEEWVAEKITQEMRKLSTTQHKHFYGTLKKAHAALMHSMDSFRLALEENINKVLGVSLGNIEWDIDIVEPDHPDVNIPSAFSYHFDLLWFLIPMFIFRGVFEKNYLKKIPWQAEVNVSRLAAQWETSINRAIDTMRSQAILYIEEELQTIESMLASKQGRTKEIQRMIGNLEEQIHELIK
jgi:ribosome biogenesis GTPase A